jgi:hypothetical protein
MTSTYQHKPSRYYAVTFTATYALWAAGAWASFHRPVLYMALMLPGLMAPFLVSLAMVFSSGSRRLKRQFVRRLWDPRLIDARGLPVFFLMMPLAVVASIALSVVLGGSPEQFHLAEGFSFSTGAVPVLLTLLLAATFEELGWRGYAFDSLESRFGFVRASVLFGVLWSLWHLPLVLVKDSYQYEILHQSVWYALNFFVGIVPLGVIISWICKNNGKSVLATILFHFIVNISQETFAVTQATKCIETAALTALAVAIVALDRKTVRAENRLAGAPRLAEVTS